MRVLAIVVLVTACGSKSGDGRAVCDKAAAKYEACMAAGSPSSRSPPPGKRARSRGVLGDDALSWADAIGAWQGGVVVVSTEGVYVTDKKLETRATVWFDADDVLLTADSVIVADPQGVAVLSLAACARPGTALELESTQDPGAGECVTARHEGGWIDQIAALPGGGVAYNDQGITEATHHVGADGRHWSTRTAATGEVAGDEVHVYAVSLGFDAAGPVRLLALARATGEIAWQTELAAQPPETPRVRIAVRDGLVAVRVGPTLHVVAALPD